MVDTDSPNLHNIRETEALSYTAVVLDKHFFLSFTSRSFLEKKNKMVTAFWKNAVLWFSCKGILDYMHVS